MSKISRRQLMGAASMLALAPLTELIAQEQNKMRGAFMILTTPYTESGEVDYEDLAREVAFCGRSGVQGIVWPQNSQRTALSE